MIDENRLTVAVDPLDETAAALMDAKASYARKMFRHRPSETLTWDHVARQFDSAADDLRLGLHHKETPDV